MIVRELVTRLGFTADTSKVKKFEKAVNGLKVAMVASVAAAGAMAAAATRLATDAAQAGREIDKLSKISNAAPEQFQRWAAAAQSVGIEQEKMSDILKDVNDRVGDFIATGGGPMADFFENIAPKVGVTADQFAKLSGPDALQLYVDSLQAANLSQQQMTFYMEAMASDSTLLIPLLRDSGKELNRLGDSAARMGLIMDEEAIRSSIEFTREQRNMRWAIQGLRLQIGARLMPTLLPMIEGFTNFVALNREMISQKVAAFFEGVGSAAKNLMTLAENLYTSAIKPLIDAFRDLDPAIQGAVVAIAAFLSPIGRAWLLMALFLAVAEDIGAWMNDQPSLIGKVFGPYEEFADKVKSVVDALGGFEVVAGALTALALAPWLLRVAGALKALGLALLTNPIVLIAAAVAGAALLIWKNWDFLKEKLGPILDVIGGYFSFVYRTQIKPFIDALKWIRDTGKGIYDWFGDNKGEPETVPGVSVPNRDFSTQDFVLPSVAAPTMESAAGAAGGVTNVNTANATSDINITVPPGSTSEQIAFIRSEVDRSLSRATQQAVLGLEG